MSREFSAGRAPARPAFETPAASTERATAFCRTLERHAPGASARALGELARHG